MLYILRIVHIVAGVFWVGSAIFGAIVLAPALRAVGPSAGPVMNQLVKVRKMPVLMMGSALATMVAGIWLLMIDSAGQPGTWMRSGTGRTFAIGGAFAILAFVLGMAINMPASKKLGAIGAAVAARGGPPTPQEQAEMTHIQGRMSVGSQIVTLLLLLATGAMAIARYVS